jgi:hypothetical protein
MGNRIDTRVVLGSLRYKTASNTNLMFNVPLIQTTKENVEFDRNIDISLEQVFDDERQKSNIFRPSCKFSVLFENSYTGLTNYTPLENNLVYVNETQASINQCNLNPEAVSWSGFPQYHEFDFIRSDYNVVGYTQPPNNHRTFISKSASTYNWNFFVSYPFENLYNKKMQAIESKTTQTLDWTASDGIPFIIENSTINGLDIISFRCPVKHGINVGEFVKLNFSYNTIDTFEVYTLGDGKSNSDLFIFNIFNVGFTGTTFDDNVEGTFKRIINNEIPNETTSKYYVRRHKILTNANDAVLVNAGFDQNIFGINKKFESSGYTPNKIERVSIKEGSQSYTLSFNADIDINPLRDNQKRPITELFFTTIWKGYFGLMFGRPKGANDGFYGMKQGYGFNLPLDPDDKLPILWWGDGILDSNTNFPLSSYTTPLGVKLNGDPIDFTYVETLKLGDTLDGDYCEWNDYEQKERIISNLYHKLTYNSEVFNIGTPSPNGVRMNRNNPYGYYYQPHNGITISEYSDYIEEGDKINVADIPYYSYYSESKGRFIWRDKYTYGYIDPKGNGVDYPFLNGVHYPYKNIIFRIIPEGTNYSQQTIVAEPIIDNCE